MLLAIDVQVSSLLNRWATASVPAESITIVLASWLIWGLLAYVLISSSFSKQYLTRAAASVIVVYAVNAILLWLWFRPRPFVTGAVVNLIGVSADSKSFPSMHAALAFTLAASFQGSGWKKFFGYALASLVVVGRVMAGVHYPSDVISGALLGILIAVAIGSLWNRITRN